MIGIISTGLGNVQSLVSLFSKLNVQVLEVSHPAHLDNATTLILPGVGAFDPAMERLMELGLVEAIKSFAKTQRVIGICLGMQLLFDTSEESQLGAEGLQLISGSVARIPDDGSTRIPNVGWHDLDVINECSDDLAEILSSNRFYFSHSYMGTSTSYEQTISVIKAHPAVSVAFSTGSRIMGFQFHPERSQMGGIRLADWIAETDD